MSDDRKILAIYTGGTIGMVATDAGLAPKSGFLADYINDTLYPDAQNRPNFDLIEFSPLLDSSQLSPHNWNEMAQCIADHYEQYDGFLVIHGTDTLSYTASALAFMLRNLAKPVVVTGAMLSVVEENSDGPDNLRHGFQSLMTGGFDQVMVSFHGQLIPGSHVSKVDSFSLDAFWPPVGIATAPEPTGNGFQQLQVSPQEICVFTFYPGCSYTPLEQALAGNAKAIVLRSYGSGNGPDDQALVALLARAQQQGLLVVNMSQCLKAAVDMTRYAAGEHFHRHGDQRSNPYLRSIDY